jgi:predicted TIM-barrel fold metal-dependent hydrolase
MTTRRSFVSGITASGISAAVAYRSLPTCNADPALANDYIDAHVHVWTPDLKTYPISTEFQTSAMVPSSFTPEELFSHCRPEGVSRIVLIQMSFYQYDNRYMLDCMKQHPGVFSGVGIVDSKQSNVIETMKALVAEGVRGFRLYTDLEKASEWASSDNMNAMWANAAEWGVSMCLLSNPNTLPLIDAMCKQHPKTRVVIDHFSRIGVDGTIDPVRLDQLCRLASYPNVYVKTSAFYALGNKRPPYADLGPMIQRLVKAFGANRLMWASDCPYQVGSGHTYADSIALIRDRLDFLSEADKRSILRDTAHQVFFAKA